LGEAKPEEPYEAVIEISPQPLQLVDFGIEHQFLGKLDPFGVCYGRKLWTAPPPATL
jgi:hypothetical protein